MGLFGKKKEVYPKIYDDIYVVAGLDVPQECKCSVELNENEIIVKAPGKEYVLSITKITNCEHRMDIDIEQYEKNGSLLKGIIGGVAFGIPGAIIGSSPKIKEKRLVTGMAILTYEAQMGSNTIMLISKPNTLGCAAICDFLQPRINVRTQRVEL